MKHLSLLCIGLFLVSFSMLPRKTASILGYHQSLVIAEVLDAEQNQIAYSSFESNDKGNWVYSGITAGTEIDLGRTGKKYYKLLTGEIHKNDLAIGRYKLSYWCKNISTSSTIIALNPHISIINTRVGESISGWSYREIIFDITNDTNLVLENPDPVSIPYYPFIDELRLHPLKAQMKTYTYEPLVGVTSETDANNISIFYEYDEFHRPWLTRDHYRNIVGEKLYHYKRENLKKLHLILL